MSPKIRSKSIKFVDIPSELSEYRRVYFDCAGRALESEELGKCFRVVHGFGGSFPIENNVHTYAKIESLLHTHKHMTHAYLSRHLITYAVPVSLLYLPSCDWSNVTNWLTCLPYMVSNGVASFRDTEFRILWIFSGSFKAVKRPIIN